MSKCVFGRGLRGKLVAAAMAVFFCETAFAAQGTTHHSAPPDFSSSTYGWLAEHPDFIAPAHGPGPIMQDPRYPRIYPQIGGLHGRTGSDSDDPRIADLDNPILQPWTRDAVKKFNQRVMAGWAGFPPKISCHPMGVPGFLLYPAIPIHIVQTPTKVWMITREDHMVRRIYLNVPHSAHVTPSWFGESVGHYEGDTLVVDTIGLNTKTFVDNFRTPHTDKLHVVERYRLNPDRKSIDVDAMIEDPGAFTMPFHAVQRYTRAADDNAEVVCADNMMHFGDIDPFPQSNKPDF